MQFLRELAFKLKIDPKIHPFRTGMVIVKLLVINLFIYTF